MSLIQRLLSGKLDIVGDIHGEYEALLELIKNMGYDKDGNHPDNRKLIFIGDLCDRGPDSPSVILLVKKLIKNGNAQAILGNHELNLLQLKAKDGAGWFFKERQYKDKSYAPFNIMDDEGKNEIYDFLKSLPLALENEDLRIVHATWDSEKINEVKTIPLGDVIEHYNKLEQSINDNIEKSGLLKAYHDEQKKWEHELEDPHSKVPFLEATSQYNVAHQMNNPMRVMTSGVEKKCNTPFFASGKWRFVERFSWWDEYDEETPVIVGHFWRKFNPSEKDKVNDENIFKNIEINAWHGKRNNVFCVDYSVGGRFKERLLNTPLGETTALVALRWPENELILENGSIILTNHFKAIKNKLTK